MSTFWGQISNVDYRRLLPSRSVDSTDTSLDYGVYEDEETRAERSQTADGERRGSQWPEMCGQLCSYLPELSLRERLLGCATCMICGYLLSFGSFLRLKDLVTGNPVPLVFNVTLGNIIALCGTCFLSGPSSQAKRMFHQSRRLASLSYLGFMFVTLILLLTPRYRGKGFLLFLLMIGQYVAITWYVNCSHFGGLRVGLLISTKSAIVLSSCISCQKMSDAFLFLYVGYDKLVCI